MKVQTLPHATAPVRRTTGLALSLPQLWEIITVALPVMISLGAPLLTIDLAYHLRAGEIMLGSHALPRTDTFSFTATGAPWLDQQWGSQILFALLFRAGGWATLAVARAALIGFTFFLVFRTCRSAGAPARVASWLTLGSFLVALKYLSLRPQLVGVALFAVTMWIVVGRRRHPAALWWMPPVVALWANIHGSFFLGPLVLFLAWLEDRSARLPDADRMLWIAVASAGAAALNPFGLRVWSYALGLSTNPEITRSISEWQPPSIRDVGGALFFASAAIVAVLLARRARVVSWATLRWLGPFFVLALLAQRAIPWWALAAAPVIAVAIQAPPPVTERHRSVANTAVAVLLSLFVLALLPWWRGKNPLASAIPTLAEAPPGITAELERVMRPGDRMFNPQPWGSWFTFALPRYKVFVDSRIEVFSRDVWEDYRAVSQGEEGWQRLLDRWRVTVVVAIPDAEDQGRLVPRIRSDPSWRLAYRDADGLVFVRNR